MIKMHFGSSWVEDMEAFTEVTKLVEATRILFTLLILFGRVNQNQV